MSLALDVRDRPLTERLLALAEAVPAAEAGVASACGFASASNLRGIIAPLLASTVPFQRRLGVTVCGMHQADPGAALSNAITDPDAGLRARALHVAVRCGRADLLPFCLKELRREDASSRCVAARAALLLGDRGAAIDVLRASATAPAGRRIGAADLLLAVLSQLGARALLKLLAAQRDVRALIRGVGTAGDTHYLPWLITQMSEPDWARVAGESFSLITGIDIADSGLEGEALTAGHGPSDDPDDASIDMDEDESLPWPDPQKIGAWWQAHRDGFATGVRYFMGAPVSREHCINILKNGYQRQRILAAHYLCLLQPGTPLFNTSAPAWRQQRLLAKM